MLPSDARLTVESTGKFTYHPVPDTTGADEFTYTITDGLAEHETSVFLAVYDDGDAPPLTIQAIPNQNSTEGQFSVSPNGTFLCVTVTQPDGGGVTYAANGLPNGLNIDARGCIWGKLRYDSAGSHTVIITVTKPGHLPATTSFTWNVQDASIGSFRAREMYRATALPNSVTTNGVGPAPILWITPGNTTRLDVSAPAGGVLPYDWSDIVYRITGAGANPASGNFNGQNWPIISLGSPGASHVVQVGIDLSRKFFVSSDPLRTL